jgi:signal transduction histidine kinase
MQPVRISVGIAALVALVAAIVALAALSNAQAAVRVAVTGAAIGLLAGAAGGGLLRVGRRTSIRAQILVCTVSAAVATAAGAWIVARLLFDLEGRLPSSSAVLFLGTGVVGIIAAVVLAAQLAEATSSLTSVLMRLPGGDERRDGRDAPSIAWLAERIGVLAQELDEARTRERRLEASRRELVAGVSHDLRTPLNALFAMAQALEDGLVSDPETVASYHATMTRETGRVVRLVDDLFELSRVEAGLELQLEQIMISDLLSDALAEIAAVAGERGVTVRSRVAGPLPPMRVSPSHIQRLLANLLTNAVRYTDPGGAVELRAEAIGDDVAVTVFDACGGIDPDELPALFQASFRGARARDLGEGTGLGLAIALGIARAHGGDMTASNRPPGCEFRVVLPVAGPLTTS